METRTYGRNVNIKLATWIYRDKQQNASIDGTETKLNIRSVEDDEL